MRLFHKKKSRILNGNIIKDAESGRYVAYFDEFPDLTAEADNEDEAIELLFIGLARISKKNKGETQQSDVGRKESVRQFQLCASS